MKKTTTDPWAHNVAVGAEVVPEAWISYKTDEAAFKHHADKYNIMTMGADVARNCLAQCKDKAVERYYVAEGKLVCECSKVKSSQKK